MAALTHSITGVLMILGLVAIGFILIRGNIFDDSDGKISRFLSGFISKVALPAYLIVHIPQDFTPKTLLAMGTNILFPLSSMMLLLVLSFFIARIIHVDPKHKGLFQSLLFNSNTITVGLPVNMALFGMNSLPYVLIYYMANTTVFWTIGVYMISIDGNHDNNHFNLKKTLAGVFNPPMIALLISLILVFINVKLPAFLVTDLTELGDTNVPLALVFIGFAIAKTSRKDLLPNKETVTLSLSRFVLAPLTMALIMMPFDLPTLLKQVFIIQSAMTAMTNAAVMALEYKADYKFASISITQTTLLMLLVIPVLMFVIQ